MSCCGSGGGHPSPAPLPPNTLSSSKAEQRNESWLSLDFNFCKSLEPQKGTKSKSELSQDSHKAINLISPITKGEPCVSAVHETARFTGGNRCVRSPAQTPLCQKYFRLQSAVRAHKSDEEDWTRIVICCMTSNSSLESQIILAAYVPFCKMK